MRHDEMPRRLVIEAVTTPIGEALLVSDDAGYLRALDWSENEARLLAQLRHCYPSIMVNRGAGPQPTRCALLDYFAGRLTALETIAWRAAGTPFQLTVWNELVTIRVGQTLSYGELALRLGDPKLTRAVGLANGANPVSIVVPCHRVIGSDGSLTGYGGGLERKRWLLRHEGAASAADQDQLFG